MSSWKIWFSTALQMRVFGPLAVFVQCERYVTAVFYHLAGINGLHQREPDGYLMCAKETGGRALAQALAAFNQSSVGQTCRRSVHLFLHMWASLLALPRRFCSHMLCNFWISSADIILSRVSFVRQTVFKTDILSEPKIKLPSQS